MPTYEHQCTNTECNYEWEDMYSITKEPPKICPKCNQETAQRVISGGSGKGTVELTGHELASKMKEDVANLKKSMSSDAKVYANLLGEEKYHQMQTQMDRRKR